MASELAKCDWTAPDLNRQIKDNDITSSLQCKTRTTKEKQKLETIETNMDKTHKSLLFDTSVWSKLFETKHLPDSSDWLWSNENDKLGQSFYDWFRLTKRFPNNSQFTIGLAPIGDFNIFYNINTNKISLMHLLSELVSIFFGIKVKLLNVIPINDKINTRISTANDIKQLQTGSILNILSETKHGNYKMFVIMGATLIDLYPNDHYNFVYGQARISDGTGVFSFARYINGFYDLSPTRFDEQLKQRKKKSRWPQVSEAKLSKKARLRRKRLVYLRELLNGENVESKQDNKNEVKKGKKNEVSMFENENNKIQFLRSCAKVLTHEIGHLFGIKHCIYWQCRMNGANHQNEFNSQPFYICPICLHKLYVAREFKMRYNKIKVVENKEEDDDEEKQDDVVNDKMNVLKKKMANRKKQHDKNVKPFDLVDRYKKLEEWCDKTGLVEEAKWYQQRLQLNNS